MLIIRSNEGYLTADKYRDYPSIFLAGPTYRSPPPLGKNWRDDAINIFKRQSNQIQLNGKDLLLFIPEPFHGNYTEQIKWEEFHLKQATVIMFWVPRNLKDLPAFTTNIEFGEWYKSGKIILGFPPEAEKMRYLEYKAQKHNVYITSSLYDTIIKSLILMHTLDNNIGD